MSRLIDANKLRKDVLELPNCYNGFSDTYDKAMIIDLIDEQPTVDAVPTEFHDKCMEIEIQKRMDLELDSVKVVRCKNCKHYVTGGYCGIVNERYNEDEFCSRGEEKEDEEEPITPEMFAERMRGIANRYYGDEEMGHIQADGLMIVLLEQLGYKEGTEIFDNMAKWYS